MLFINILNKFELMAGFDPCDKVVCDKVVYDKVVCERWYMIKRCGKNYVW